MNEKIRIEGDYFAAAVSRWDDVNAKMRGAWYDASGIQPLPSLWTRMGSLDAAVNQLNDMAEQVKNGLLSEGIAVTGNIADTLMKVARQYLKAEEANEAEVAEIEKKLNHARNYDDRN